MLVFDAISITKLKKCVAKRNGNLYKFIIARCLISRIFERQSKALFLFSYLIKYSSQYMNPKIHYLLTQCDSTQLLEAKNVEEGYAEESEAEQRERKAKAIEQKRNLNWKTVKKEEWFMGGIFLFFWQTQTLPHPRCSLSLWDSMKNRQRISFYIFLCWLFKPTRFICNIWGNFIIFFSAELVEARASEKGERVKNVKFIRILLRR